MSADPLVGKVLGGFRVVSLIAAGGYGRVYAAEQVTLGRRAALKVTDPRTLDTPVKRKRFLREAQILARFQHPNIVQVYESGREGDSIYLAMELVEGTNLAARIERGEWLSPEQALRVAREGLSALARAHREGVIHRDVKPGNILMTAEGEVKLTDFGLAKDLGSASLTDPGIILGTPLYMSPEQSRGEEPDARCDVFSLGATIYHALTGHAPMSDRDLERGTPIATEAPPPVREVAPKAPGDLAAWIERAMARDPAAGFATAEAALAALPPPVDSRATRGAVSPAAVWTWRILASAAAACLTVTAVALWTRPWETPTTPPPPPAPAPPTHPVVKVPRQKSAEEQRKYAEAIPASGERRTAWLAVIEYFATDRRACAEALLEVARIDEQTAHAIAAARTYRRILSKYADQKEACREARQRLRDLPPSK